MDDLTQRISEMVQQWRDAGSVEHAEHLRRQMWALLGPFIAPARAFAEDAA